MNSNDFAALFNLFYNEVSSLGCAVIKWCKILSGYLSRFVGKPLLFILHALASFAKFILSATVRSLKTQLGIDELFTKRILNALKNLKNTLIKHPFSVIPVLFYYFKKALSRYRKFFNYIGYWIVPVCAAVIMFITIGHFSDVCIALRIDTAEGTIGYVASESDYLKARDLAKERLGLSTDNTTNSIEMLPDVTYTLSLININQYTGSSALCDKLIESSSSNIIHACGVYVDSQFLCAVKNEADAKRVFNTLLEEVEATHPDGIVSFVQDIDYVEGLYPDTKDVIWDSSELLEYVKSKETSTSYHTVQEGDSYARIANKYNLTLSQLYAMNPSASSSSILRVGDQITVSLAESFFTVQVTKTEIYTEKIEYSTVEIQSDALYTGTSRIVVEGVDGLAQVTSLITYIDGKQVSVEEVSRLTVKEPVAERIQVGTKPLDSSYTGITSQGGILLWPTINAFNINSDYGYRWGKLHSALDIGSSSGTSLGKLVVAAAEGTVVIAGYHSSYGYYVKIDHGNGMQTLYAHCLKGSLMVNAGDKVTAGQSIARVGMTGFATGPHLHFEVIINGKKVDPKPYLGID